MYAVSDDVSLVFSTPLSVRMLSDAGMLNDGLEGAILKRYQEYAGNRISNIGGWQSLPDFLDWPEPEVRRFAQEIDSLTQRIWALPSVLEGRPNESNRFGYRAYGWVNLNESGHYNSVHMHPGEDWSVVYYVRTGTPKPDHAQNGCLELRDPRPAAAFARMPGSRALLIKPKAGMIVAFPAWIEHWVHPFQGEGQRISIAVNIAFERP